jgi:hypothetical protein
MAATSPAGGAAPRLRSVDSSSGDLEMAGASRTPELKEHKDEKHTTRSRAVGSLAHVAATALKRKNVVIRVAVAAIVAFFAAAGIAKVTRRVLFHSDVKSHCESLPSNARVAILLAGSPRAFNKTHCSFARRVVKPLRDRGHPVDVYFSSTEPLAEERLGIGAERAALEKLRSDHGVTVTIIDVAATARAPETCAAAMRERFARANNPRASSLSAKNERFTETALDDDASRTEDADVVSAKTPSENVGSWVNPFGDVPGDVISEYLLLLRARAAAEASRKKQAFKESDLSAHAWIVSANPAHAYADDVPVNAMCAVPGGRKLSAPWVRARGGVNDRFAMGQPPAMEEYAGMYHSLCPEDTALDDAKDSVPRGVDSTERLLAWYMRRRHVVVDVDALYRFVPYETPADPKLKLNDFTWPDAAVGRSAFNPSRGDFDKLADETERCGREAEDLE